MHAQRGRIVTPEEVIDDGVVAYSGAVITHVGSWDEAPPQVRDTGAQARPQELLLPGLVDVHNHGGGGVSIPDTSAAQDVATAVAEHRRFGTTQMVASLVAAPADALRGKVEMLAGLADQGVIAGIHLEGPFISHARCGAQNPAHIISGDGALTADLVRRGRGHVRTMTVAPETENFRDVVMALADGGAVPSFGHTDADEETMRDAIDFTADVLAGTGRRATITHLFNGMRPIHHRTPGPVPPALAAARNGLVIAELIGDGVHLHPGLVRDVFQIAGADNLALITDAMAAAGMVDGEYRLGGLDIVVAAGVARLAGGDSIAGGTAHLLDVVRKTVEGGVDLVEAVRAAATIPARIIMDEPSFGALRVGGAADIVRTTSDLQVLDVFTSTSA